MGVGNEEIQENVVEDNVLFSVLCIPIRAIQNLYQNFPSHIVCTSDMVCSNLPNDGSL
jgi:hypothetical protein